MIELTPEQEVQRNYDAAMDSVNLLNAGKPVEMTDEDWQIQLSVIKNI